jgi:hypothetical protein
VQAEKPPSTLQLRALLKLRNSLRDD